MDHGVLALFSLALALQLSLALKARQPVLVQLALPAP